MDILIIGCGRTGSGLARSLAGLGHAVTVIDENPEAFDRLGAGFAGRTLTGVGFDRDLLEEAGIREVDGLAAVTGSDEANAVIARVATVVFRVPRVVARLFDRRQAEIYRRLGVQVIAPAEWGVARLTELLTFSGVGAIATLGDGQVDLVEGEIHPLLVGRPVGEITAAGEVLPVAISRSGRTFIPTSGTHLEAGDIVHLAVESRSHGRARQWLEQG